MTRPAAALLCLALALAALPGAAQTRADPEAATGLRAVPLVTAESRMIVTANPHATGAGLAAMRAGGSAADAAIAALLVLGVVEPQSSGIGGGAFAVIHGPDGVTTLDGRETAPAAAGPDWFVVNGRRLDWPTASQSGRAVGVPGLLRLMERLHATHGRLPWARLVTPAIVLAERGFTVSPRLAGLTRAFADRLARTEAGAVFLPGGRPLEAGERMRRPALARTLREIAENGPGAFYEGRIAKAISAAAGRPPNAASLTPADLAAYEAIERPAVCHPWRGHRVCGMGPPSSGATTVGQMLMLEEASEGRAGDGPAALWHRLAEASRLAYADRARYLGDADFVDVPVAGLLDPHYIGSRAALIGAEAADGAAEAGTPPGAPGLAPSASETSPGTTHLSVIDGDGLAVSLTASIETAFGSGRMAAGVLLNNQLTDFSFRATDDEGRPVANAPGQRKRPRSSMAPTIVYREGEDDPAILLGSPGGSRIPEYVAGALLRMVVGDADPSGAAAGFHVSDRNRGPLVLERTAPDGVAEALAGRGHAVERAEMTSGLHIIAVTADGLEGGADPRREGLAAGD